MHGFEQQDRALRWLFLDLNSYFASVEQQEHPELRDKPVAVVPVEADSSFVIAASYEAKAHGVKTGTRIGDAKAMCPGLICVKGDHSCYMHYHERILDAIEEVLPVDQVCSIDEMRIRLLGKEREPDQARALASKIKSSISSQVGPYLKCSIGIAPNPFLAKVGTELQKPDGLVVLEVGELEERLSTLKLTDFPGINKRMLARLQAHGIFTTPDLLLRTEADLRRAFGSIIGARWWFLLRGYDLPEEHTHRRSLGHSHVLPPDLRTPNGARQVLLRLVTKAASRLRANGLWTQEVEVAVRGRQKWSAHTKCQATHDTTTLVDTVLRLWESSNFEGPNQVSVTFLGLIEAEAVTPSLFEDYSALERMSDAFDSLNQKFGKNTVYLAAMHDARKTAEERIAFQKTKLFSEGKSDHDWVNARNAKTK